jgi:hypothetical protein
MPKIYEYFGLIFLFYSQEHEPIHIHGKYQDMESKAEIVFENGKFKEIVIKDVLGKGPLDTQNLKSLKKWLSYIEMTLLESGLIFLFIILRLRLKR